MPKKYLKYYPEANIDLQLRAGIKEQDGDLLLENISDEPVAFKVLAPNADFLSIEPAYGVLGGQEKRKVHIIYSNGKSQRGGKTQVRVYVAPLDVPYHSEQDVSALFRRRGENLTPEHKLHVQYGPNVGLPEEEELPHLSLKSGGKPVPALLRVPARKSPKKSPAVVHGITPEEKEVVVKEAISKKALEDLVLQEVAHAEPIGESSQSRFHIGQKLMNRFSSIGEKVKKLTSEAKKLKESQKFTVFIFWVLLVLLLVLLGFLVAAPAWRHYSRRHHGLDTLVEDVSDAAAGIGDMFNEDKEDMNFDGFIHSKI